MTTNNNDVLDVGDVLSLMDKLNANVLYEDEISDHRELNALKGVSIVKVFKHMDHTNDDNSGKNIIVHGYIFSKMKALLPLGREKYIPIPNFITKEALNYILTQTSPNIIPVLALHIKICNFLGWEDDVLNALYIKIAACISYNEDITFLTPVSYDSKHDSVYDANKKLDFNSIGFRHLFALRLHYFGPPSTVSYDDNNKAEPIPIITVSDDMSLEISNTLLKSIVDMSNFADQTLITQEKHNLVNKPNDSEMLELQRYWWCMEQQDPIEVIEPLPLQQYDMNLEKENIEQILLYAEFPTYKPSIWLYAKPHIGFTRKRGSETKLYRGEMVFHNDNIGNVTLPNNRLSNLIDISHCPEIFATKDQFRMYTKLDSYETLCNEYNYVMSNYCDRMEHILKALHVKLILCWCGLYFVGIFEPNLYMLRFPKPPKIAVYRDIISTYVNSQISTDLPEVGGYRLIPLPLSYQNSVNLLQEHKTKINLPSLQTNNIITKFMSGFKLNLKTDAELTGLCEQHSILCVEYNRRQIIDVLSKYV